MSEKLIKINDSEKTRKTPGILPEVGSHTGTEVSSPGEAGCGAKAKQHKYKIIGFVLVAVLALVLGITLSESSDKPGPGPTPTPNPPVPPNKNYNMYYLSPDDQVQDERHMITGKLRFQMPNTTLEESLGKTTAINLNPLQIHKFIPIGPNNDYIKNVAFSFS